MSRNLLLLTGATGFIGYNVLLEALKEGYNVRCAIRSPTSVDRILATQSIKDLQLSDDRLSWVTVPDITKKGAYDEAVKGVNYIIHCASPVRGHRESELNDESASDLFVKPAVQGTVGMLESARQNASSTVKRIVLTSSVVAIFPTELFVGDKKMDMSPFNAYSRLPTPEASASARYGPYFASKISALNESESWFKAHQPAFDFVNIIPAWVWGRNELASTGHDMGESNMILVGLLTGFKFDNPINSAVVSVEDVAVAHVRALRPRVAGHQSFILGRLENLDTVNAIAKSHFPQAFEDGVLSEKSQCKAISIPMDSSDAESKLEMKLMPLEEIVRNVAGQYVEFHQR